MQTRYDINLQIIPLYLESARTYLQLSLALLGLTVAFRKYLLGDQALPRVGWATVVCWTLLLLAIGASALYQYAAVHFLDALSGSPGKPFLPSWLVSNPGRAYGVMVVSFYLSTVFFIGPAWSDVRSRIAGGKRDSQASGGDAPKGG